MTKRLAILMALGLTMAACQSPSATAPQNANPSSGISGAPGVGGGHGSGGGAGGSGGGGTGGTGG
ncbi:hypothetical protein [Azospirillum sp. sgz301742]